MRRAAMLFWLSIFAAAPALAQAPAAPLQMLERRLAATTSENPGEYGIAALDLADGRMVSVNGNVPFPMASTVKVAVAATYLAEVDAGRRSLDDQVGEVSAATLMNAMLTRSDNRATDQLLAMLGGPAIVDQWLRAHDLQGIRVDRTIAQLLSDRRDLRDVRDFEHADGDAEAASDDRQRPGVERGQPRPPARHDEPLRHRLEPDPGVAASRYAS